MPGRKPKIPDEELVGKRFGKLLVTGVVRELHLGTTTRYVLATCECGKEIKRRTYELGTAKHNQACSTSCAITKQNSKRQQMLYARKENHSKIRLCIGCGKQLINKALTAKYCNSVCSDHFRPRRSGRPKLKGPCTCQNPKCNKVYYHRTSGHKNRKDQGEVFCSRRCYLENLSIKKVANQLKEEEARFNKKTSTYGTIGVVKVRHVYFVSSKCKCCGNNYKLNNKQQLHKGPKGIKHNRGYCLDCRQLKRIFKFGCAHETVNETDVFSRDEWKCKHCGCSTPKKLRGTIEPNAPELDHILPLSKQGAHSYFNTQCLCRKCNHYKNGFTEREPRLLGVTDLTPYKIAKCKGHFVKRPSSEPAICKCGCLGVFIPFVNGNAEYKAGHWMKTKYYRKRAREEWGPKGDPNNYQFNEDEDRQYEATYACSPSSLAEYKKKCNEVYEIRTNARKSKKTNKLVVNSSIK